jgi:misacylated tRNA(Ala) deacylase
VPTEELYATDAYRRTFVADVVGVDEPRRLVALRRTAFYPGGGGQPPDVGELVWGDGRAPVVEVIHHEGLLWHRVAEDHGAPAPGEEVEGHIDWDRRYRLMRTHTALHVLCGVIWADFGVAVTGGNMGPGEGRLDFPLDAASVELGGRLERRINDEIDGAREVLVDFVDRAEADADPALIRTQANLVPEIINPLRVIDIVGLDKQADGGTHVGSTAEVGRVRVVKAESKGKRNKRVRLALDDAEPESADA